MKKTITTSNKTAIFFIGIFLSLMITTALTSSIIPAVFAAQHGGDKQKFTAQLSGDQQAPPVQTSATGSAWFKPMQDGVSFEVNVSDIQGVTMAHIHSGKLGENGPPIVPLFKSDPIGQMSGILTKGNATADTFQGPMAGKPLSDLITAMQNGQTYVNIHTEQHPMGEIRGQIIMSNSTTK